MSWLSTEFYNYPGSSRCRAVHMMLKLLNVEYDDKLVDLLKAENKRPWFVRLNPLHSLPTLNDKGYVLWDSRAIMMYVCNKYCVEENQYLYPLEPDLRGIVDKFMFFDMGTLNYAIEEYFKPLLHHGMPPDSEKENMLKQSLDYLDGFLEEAGTPYLAGDNFTIADVSILASITDLDAFDYNYKYYGEVFRYINRLKENVPNYKDCCEKGVEMMKDRIKNLEDEYVKVERKRSETKSKIQLKNDGMAEEPKEWWE